MGILHESMHKTLRGMPLFSLLLPSILWFNLSTALRMASKWSLEEQWWPHKYDFQRPLLLCRPEIARFVQFSLRFDYGWGHKVYSLLPLVARKLANECVVSTPVEIPPLLHQSSPPCRQKLQSSDLLIGEAFARISATISNQEHADRDVIPVFNLLDWSAAGVRTGRIRHRHRIAKAR